MALLRFNANVNRLYFFDLMGASTGALGIILAMYLAPPVQMLTVVSAIGLCGVVAANVGSPPKLLAPVIVIAVGFIIFLGNQAV